MGEKNRIRYIKNVFTMPCSILLIMLTHEVNMVKLIHHYNLNYDSNEKLKQANTEILSDKLY